jgi:hypothetical protein
MKNKIILGLLFTFTIFHLTSCDTSQANPYKEMYEQQVVVNKSLAADNDSLKADMDLLKVRMQLIYDTSIFKIDSLHSVVTQKNNTIAQQNITIAQQDSLITNAQRDFQVFLDGLENDLENLSDQALQNLINIQKR